MVSAFLGRLFILVQEQLMSFASLARCVGGWRSTRDAVMASLRQSLVWRPGGAFRRIAQHWLQRLRGSPE